MAAPAELLVIGFDEPSSTIEPPASITTWRPSTTSSAAIEKKMAQAAARKEDDLKVKMSKANRFTQKASKGCKKAQDDAGVVESSMALESKLSSASSKRISLSASIVAKLAAKRAKTKQRKALLEEEDSDKLMEVAAKANERMHAAETRKELQQTKQVEVLVQQHQSKVVAAAEAKHQTLVLAQDKGDALEKRLAAAQTRKELLMAEQVESLVQTHQDKAVRVQETRKLEEYQGRDGSARLANKIQAAEDRRAKTRQGMLSTNTIGDKVARVEALKTSDSEKAAELLAKNTEKLAEAADRRTAVLGEKTNKIGLKAQATAKRLENQKAIADVATCNLRDLLDAKMAIAEENRQEHLFAVSDRSNSSFAFSSPSKSPATTTKLAIDRKLEAAAARRAEHLLLRSSGKRTSRSLMAGDFDLPSEEEDVAGNLFPSLGLSPPPKKARVESTGGLDKGPGPVARKHPDFNVFAFLQDFWAGLSGNVGELFTKLLECFRR